MYARDMDFPLKSMGGVAFGTEYTSKSARKILGVNFLLNGIAL